MAIEDLKMFNRLEENAKEFDEYCMREALKQAKMAYEKDEVPVGAVITFKNQIIAKAYNQVEMLKDPTAHAEMLAITQAASHLGQKWLNNCHVYVTLEPCSMCAGALVLARVKKIFYAAKDPKTGACGSVLNVANHNALNHRIEVGGGILEEFASPLITDFFQKKRKID